MNDWKLVPKEPTQEMIDEAWKYGDTVKSDAPDPVYAYRAMLKVAPVPEVEPTAWVERHGNWVCVNFCTPEAERKCPSGAKLYLHPAPPSDLVMLRADIQTMADALADGVWAHIISSDDDINALDAGITSIVGKLTALQAENVRLKEALKPFAAYAEHYPKDRKYGNRPGTGEWHSVESGGLVRAQIDVEDFHRAADALQKEKP